MVFRSYLHFPEALHLISHHIQKLCNYNFDCSIMELDSSVVDAREPLCDALFGISSNFALPALTRRAWPLTPTFTELARRTDIVSGVSASSLGDSPSSSPSFMTSSLFPGDAGGVL